MALWDIYYTATTLDDAVRLLSEHAGQARIMAGGTDMIVELEHRTRTAPVMIDITRIGGLDEIRQDSAGFIHLGPLVTHAQAAASPLLQDSALPLAQACWGVGGPALRNRGTIAGNLVTASPANDTITALRALEAKLTLRSVRGERTVMLADFYTGVRRSVMEPDEMLVDIAFAALNKEVQRGIYMKLGLRRTLAIAVVNVAAVLAFDGEEVIEARIALGSVAPTIIRAANAESLLVKTELTDERIAGAATAAGEAARPIDDVRASAWFRQEEVVGLVQRALELLRDNNARQELPRPGEMVMLWGKTRRWPRLTGGTVAHHAGGSEPIECTVNGRNVLVEGANGKTLLAMLRDDLGLMGTKEGCGEGECGACTVYLDGIATLACLTPAPRAHGASITTIEGLSHDDQLHPVQEAFIEEGAVQCGYCTPGFVMSAVKLLEERPQPTREQIITALSGNLCRCTGYYKIISAVEKAATHQEN